MAEQSSTYLQVGELRVPQRVGYLTAQFPVLSETFVYREMLALSRTGITVKNYALRSYSNRDVDIVGLPAPWTVYQGSFLGNFLQQCNALLKEFASWPRLQRMLREDWGQLSTMEAKARLFYQVTAAARLATQLRADKVQHLHVHFIHSSCQIAMYAAALADIPYSVTAHANDIFSRGELLLSKARRAKKLVTISEYNARYFEKIGVAPDHIRVIRCLLNLPDWRGVASERRRVIGSLGRLVPKKGFAILIQAYAEILSANPAASANWVLEIAGTGPQEAELKGLVADLGISDQVKFLGAMQPVEVLRWMAGLGCFALACQISTADQDVDGIPVVLMEAMATGTPVLSTRISGIPELVVDGVTGWLCEPGDVSELADTLRLIISSPDERDRRVAEATRHLELEFGEQKNLHRLLSVFASP